MLSLSKKITFLGMLFLSISCSKNLSKKNTTNNSAGIGVTAIEPVPEPIILLQPQSQFDQEVGSTVDFGVLVSGDIADYSFSWFKNDVAIPNSNASVLTLVNITIEDEANYHVTILSGPEPGEALSSDKASLTVKRGQILDTVAPQFLDQADFMDREVEKGSNQAYAANVIGTNLVFTWYFRPLSNTQNSFFILNNNSNKLLLDIIDDENAGSYYVTVTNDAGSVTSQISIMTVLATSPTDPGSGSGPEPDPQPVYLENQIAAGYNHSCGIRDGALYCWGKNTSGFKVDSPVTTIFSTPTLVPEMDNGVTQVVAGRNHTCALKKEKMYCWGVDIYGQVGDGTQRGRTLTLIEDEDAIAGLTDISYIAAGEYTSCAITGGKLICWGLNKYGLTGDTLIPAVHSSPNLEGKAGLTSGVTAVALGTVFNCAIKDGAVLCWGYNRFKQLGNGGTTQSTTPTQVIGLDSGVTAVSVGSYHACAVHKGDVKCWGHGWYGQVGASSREKYQNIKVTISGFGEGILSLNNFSSCGYSFTNSKLQCWGWNKFGQVGIGSNDTDNLYVTEPKDVQAFSSDIASVRALSPAIFRHTCILAGAPEEFHCWGANESAQIGIAAGSPVLSPVVVPVVK